jgi:hypothetical protein
MASSISFPTEGSFALSNWRYSQRAAGGTKNTFSARYSSLSLYSFGLVASCKEEF